MAQISLKNFRKYESLEPLYLNGLNIFVGKNNAGKSTVVKAIMLALDNLRSLRWNNVPTGDEGILQKRTLPVPMFRFDANGFHNLHIGTFDRARCNYSDGKSIVFDLEYQGIGFKMVVSGNIGEGQVTVPVESLCLTFPTGGSYEFNFSQQFVSFKMTKEEESDLDRGVANELVNLQAQIEKRITEAEESLKLAIKNSDALQVAQLNEDIKKLVARRNQLAHSAKVENDEKPDVHFVTFPLYYLHEHAGENVLVQYFRSLVRYAESPNFHIEESGDMLSGQQKAKSSSILYKAEMGNRSFVLDRRPVINRDAAELENVLASVNVEYLQAHAATQKLILTVDDRQDINSKIIHEYYQEGIQPGDPMDLFLKKWLAAFEIGESVEITQLDGEGYYVKVEIGGMKVHLADMGMGSIQLVVLMLRLATLGNRCLRSGQSGWVFIEEPEQNIHPLLQSRLAELFYDFQQSTKTTVIVETHSEYLIRKTQLMCAGMNYTSDKEARDSWPVTTLYFPVETDEQPYDMIYLANGRFKKSFGSGFYDAAGSLAIELSSKEVVDGYAQEINWSSL